MVLLVVYEMVTGKFLNSLVTNLVSFSVYVNFTNLRVSFLSHLPLCFIPLLLFRVEGSYLLFYITCRMIY